jgi:hypothetical protein
VRPSATEGDPAESDAPHSFENACNWWKTVESQINARDYEAISRGNAVKLLKLEKVLA